MEMPTPIQTPASGLQAGRDYPPSNADLQACFLAGAACLDCLKWLRWPNGFFCPQCGTSSQWRMEGGRFWCAPCQRRSCD
ncbi:transposase, partial [Methyloglobulus sp.]|uniref:transposase n=1 Tax=Methyloglobulus sp. TaxID=2518622 RepID=UPI00398A324E